MQEKADYDSEARWGWRCATKEATKEKSATGSCSIFLIRSWRCGQGLLVGSAQQSRPGALERMWMRMRNGHAESLSV